MHRRFKAISISHHTAPVEIRERLALSCEETSRILEQIKEYYSIRDVLVLSTCNRTEIYYASGEDLTEELIKILAIEKNQEHAGSLRPFFKSILKHNDTVRHLFRVTIGLESQIVGDMQITNQVKTAYQLCADADLAGPFLHRLLHTAFFANKRVVQETAFRDGAASVSYATLELIADLTSTLERPIVLIAGLGTVGSDLCKNIAGNKNFQDHQVIIVNRTDEKAQSLATECGFTAIPWELFGAYLETADVIISAIGPLDPVIRKHEVSEIPMVDYKYFIDLGVPRSIEPSIEEINGVVLYNIDDIQSRADEALNRRLQAIPQVEALVADAIVGFDDWTKDLGVSPTINKLKNALEQIRKQEIARHLKDAKDNESLIVEKVTKSIMQKVIKLPVLQLKAACRRGEEETLIDVLNDLFNLEKEPISPDKQ